MEKVLDKIGKFSSLLTKYIGIVIIAFSVLAFFFGRAALRGQPIIPRYFSVLPCSAWDLRLKWEISR